MPRPVNLQLVPGEIRFGCLFIMLNNNLPEINMSYMTSRSLLLHYKHIELQRSKRLQTIFPFQISFAPCHSQGSIHGHISWTIGHTSLYFDFADTILVSQCSPAQFGRKIFAMNIPNFLYIYLCAM